MCLGAATRTGRYRGRGRRTVIFVEVVNVVVNGRGCRQRRVQLGWRGRTRRRRPSWRCTGSAAASAGAACALAAMGAVGLVMRCSRRGRGGLGEKLVVAVLLMLGDATCARRPVEALCLGQAGAATGRCDGRPLPGWLLARGTRKSSLEICVGSSNLFLPG